MIYHFHLLKLVIKITYNSHSEIEYQNIGHFKFGDPKIEFDMFQDIKIIFYHLMNRCNFHTLLIIQYQTFILLINTKYFQYWLN